MTYIDENFNVCNLGEITKKITGLSSNSSSPTDTWIVYFNDDVLYNYTYVNSGFLKIFIDDTKTDNLLALKYELNIYKDVIRPLVDLNICPNFVKYLASSTNCSYNNLLNFLKGKVKKTDGSLSLLRDEQVEINFIRNSLFCLLRTCSDRPSIQQIQLPINSFLSSGFLNDVKTNIKFSMILNEETNPGTLKYNSFLTNR